MQTLFNAINIPLGYVLKLLSELFGGNFAASVFAFTLFINLVLIPLTIKSQKSSVAQMRIKPKLDELKKRYGDDRKRMAQEQQKLYQEEGVSMSGGCLPLIVRMLLLFSIYYLILSPLTYMAGADKSDIKTVTSAFNSYLEDNEDAAKELSWNVKNTRNQELYLVAIIQDDPTKVEKVIGSKEYEKIKEPYENIVNKYKDSGISFNLFGIDLIEKPNFSVDIFNNWQPIWLLPIAAFLAQMLTSVVTMRINKRINPDAPTMAGLMLFMPLISLFIGFSFPGGVCFYWICSSLIGGAVQSCIQILYGPHKLLARERTKELVKICDFEAEQRKKTEIE